MHRLWCLPELIVHIVSFLPHNDLDQCFHVSHHLRETLKNNLPPYRRPLPDGGIQKPDWALLPQPIRSLASHFKTQDDRWALLPDMGDDYFFWREGAHQQLLQRLGPHLHPFLFKHAWVFAAKLDFVSRGRVGIYLQTKCSATDYYNEFYNENTRPSDPKTYLSQPPPSNVEVYCLKGAEWNLSFANAQYQESSGWQRLCVRIEREKGVRMIDVVDELRDVLTPSMGLDVGSDVCLEWHFDDAVHQQFEMQ
ncbi:hypothetical protein BKA66DRAFT_289924 [Pyrenochaeta sp. MPI-SDFR-AT-0127]|nr:hypothetical protein BKA66DRAFT_289924 [Pyrenochaeta sp. MPI-SDFR-AT-0127]